MSARSGRLAYGWGGSTEAHLSTRPGEQFTGTDHWPQQPEFVAPRLSARRNPASVPCDGSVNNAAPGHAKRLEPRPVQRPAPEFGHGWSRRMARVAGLEQAPVGPPSGQRLSIGLTGRQDQLETARTQRDHVNGRRLVMSFAEQERATIGRDVERPDLVPGRSNGSRAVAGGNVERHDVPTIMAEQQFSSAGQPCQREPARGLGSQGLPWFRQFRRSRPSRQTGPGPCRRMRAAWSRRTTPASPERRTLGEMLERPFRPVQRPESLQI